MIILLAKPLLGATLVLPVEEIPRARITPEGYIVRTVAYDARVLFPSHDWTHIEGGYLVDPVTRAALTFGGRWFGHKPKTFLIWGYTVREHQWARELNLISDQDEKQSRFLKEWIERALRRQEIDLSDDLRIGYPILTADQKSAVFFPLSLSPADQAVNIKHQTIGSHRFASVELTTQSEIAGRTVRLNTTIYICGFRYWTRLDDWQFFTAMSHVPTDASPEDKERIRDLFLRTLPSVSIVAYE